MKSIVYTILLSASLLIASLQLKGQVKIKNSTSKKDSISTPDLLDSLTLAKTKEELLTADNIQIQKNLYSNHFKIDSLTKLGGKNPRTQTELAELRAKEQSLTSQLKINNLELNIQKLNYEIFFSKIQMLTKSLPEIKKNKEKQTTLLKKDTSGAKENDDEQNNESDTEDDGFKSHATEILKKTDSLEVIAIIEKRGTVNIYSRMKLTEAERKKKISEIISTKTKAFSFDRFGNVSRVIKSPIQQVHILASEGIMRELVVYTNDGIFRNKSSVIDLVHMDTRNNDTLRYERQQYYRDGKYRYIFLDDVIKYTPVQSYSDLPYADFNITLDKDHPSFVLKESTSVNSYVNISAFTDIKGISGEPNGIAQFSGEGKFITNTRNFRNGATVWLNYLSVLVGLAKYDSKFNGTMLVHKDSIDRSSLLQRSSYNVGVKLNLLHGLPSPYPHHLLSDWQLNIGYNFIGSRVSDTTFKDKARTVIDTAFRTVTMNEWYIEPSVSVARHKNFGLTLSLPFRAINIKQSGKIKNDGTEYWATPGIDVMYYGKRDLGNKLFFRYHHNINLNRPVEAYTQIQVGYSLSLTNIWGK
ncbi:hypothetical protein SNE25_04120 [Mucilaginibacter sabulilitoris]|uniref:POTRA domain-containing protein n=1 Tax=Mucilaginibacter sabulilitoris TaxID=1173583 RepID=A0ABZ0TU64_9SPHI|nr:hypothetical protein [Mucilaginibacter sabulilitoris]WPU94705.1 hypothetical protein SNE25_04120 [Mucilaginibacter sabulilitoris]